MTIATGIIARCLYLAADLVLYGGVLGYQTVGTRRKTCSAGLFLAGFVCITAIFPTLPYAAWLMYGMLWLGMELLYEKLPVGLVVFVFSVKNMLFRCICQCVTAFFGESFLWDWIGFVQLACQATLLMVMVVIAYMNKRSLYISTEMVAGNIRTIWAGFFLMMAAALSISWAGPVPETTVQMLRNQIGMRNSILGIVLLILLLVIMQGKERKRQLLIQIELNERCIREQTEQYHNLERKQQELRAFRHDLNGHMTALLKLVQEDNPEKTETYLKGLFDIQTDSFYISSNNIIGDAIFNQYYEKCRTQGLELQVAGKFNDTLNVAETDLCIILTNTVSNAYEAALKCGHGSQILVDIKQFNHKTLIEITNPVQEPLIIEGGVMVTTKDDKENHGLGIYNTKKAVERNGGLISWEQQGKNIVTKIVI